MRKKITGFMVAGILVLGLGFASTPAQAELSLGVVGGYYSPNFGKINDDYLAGLGTDLEFKAGAMYGLVLGYDLGSRFGLRLEYDSFESKTSDEERDFKLTVTPMMLSLTYGLSPAYIGAGVGLFSTELKDTYGDSESDSDSDSPTGLVLLGGFGFGDRPIFLNLEARYVVGTKPKLEDFGTEVDLSGLQLSLLTGFKF
jgi:hypothetical protein